MRLQASFDVLSRIVEQYEADGRTVRHVEATTDDGGGFQVELQVPVSLCAASDGASRSRLTPESATLTENGGLAVEFAEAGLPDLTGAVEAAVTANETAVHVLDGTVTMTVELTIDPDKALQVNQQGSGQPEQGGRASGSSGQEQETDRAVPTQNSGSCCGSDGTDSGGPAESDSGASDQDWGSDGEIEGDAGGQSAEDQSAGSTDGVGVVRDESVPLFEDERYLQALYDSFDTFTEMSRVIEMDISSETVRRYMIEAGIHDPSTYNVAGETNETNRSEGGDGPVQSTAAASDPRDEISDEQLVTDGIGLPEGVELEDIADAIVESKTVYEVQQQLGLERQQTQDLLRQLNLIDLTMRRVAEAPDQPVSYEQIAARLRQASPSGA